jgi:Family of unknown function (DUF6074)
MDDSFHTCVLIAFPTERRVGLIRSTSKALLDRNKEAGTRHMKMQCNRIHAGLQASGFDEQTIKAEIEAFVWAVAMNMQQSTPNQNPKGAA